MKNMNLSIVTEDSGVSFVRIFQVLVVRSYAEEPVVLYSFFNRDKAFARRDSLAKDYYCAFVSEELVFF